MNNLQLKISLLELNAKRLKVAADDKWRTTETGSHFKLDGNDNIVAGFGGKFTGLSMSEVKRKDNELTHGKLAQVKESQYRKEERQEANSPGAIRDRMMEALKSQNDEIDKRNNKARKDFMKKNKDVSDKYNAMTPAEKRKFTKEFGKPGGHFDTTGLTQEPNISPESAGLNPKDFQIKPNQNVKTSHEIESGDLLSQRGAAKTSHEFDDYEDADDYVNSIDEQLTDAGYVKSFESDGGIRYAKGNHVYIIDHNLDGAAASPEFKNLSNDEIDAQYDTWDADKKQRFDDLENSNVAKVSIKSQMIDDSLKGAEPIKKIETTPNDKLADLEAKQKQAAHNYSKGNAKKYIDQIQDLENQINQLKTTSMPAASN